MKQKLSIFIGGLIAFCLPVQTHAQEKPAPISAKAVFGPEKDWSDITEIQVVNFQGESLGRIQDLALDLSNGRIVAVLVVSDQTFRMGGKTVAVPPQAFFVDIMIKAYRLKMSTEAFKAAPAFDLDKWAESTSTDQVAAAYKYFGQAPYFLVAGEAGRTTPAGRTVEKLGIVERMSKLINMNVTNPEGVRFGRLQSLVLDVPNGRILNAYIQYASTNTEDTLRNFSTVIPPMMLRFNAARDTLVLDLTKLAYSEQPHVIFQLGADGQQVISSAQQAATGPHTNVPLVQGTSFRDIRLTAQIYKLIEDGKLDPGETVEVGTTQGRVTLRGPVKDQATKDSIGAIAIAAARVENVDNQIEVKAQASQAQAAL